ncbi:putative Coiled-coil domain-containing protein 174 [Hypsibius exemplaris]|uniref:Coiled-coil domain-containing protein 174 n=1 Tax=Hypsibius exemplaris TaxID=2072580 RepID=A0A1W0X245_HYPEX|nr:putative Coiled-coil domain-containing protein 174 [Hypsibius exemplaris]
MSKKVPYEVSGSSLVNLKAELYRKQAESKRKGESGPGATIQKGYVAVQNNSLKSKIKSAKTKPSKAESSLSNAEQTDEQSESDRGWEKAKIKLAEKAKRYDQMEISQYCPEEGEDEHLLVDFSRKAHDVRNFKQKESRRFSSDSDDSDSETIGPLPLPRNSEEEWTEYEDYLGRSRRCLRRDLPSLLEQNRKLKAEMATHSVATDSETAEAAQPAGFDFGQSPLEERTLLSDDMRREVERRRWEQEELFGTSTGDDDQSDPNTRGKVPIHYQTVENNEIREKGVGYFKFSKEEEKRNEELEELKRLHQQTLTLRSQKDQVKAKRKAASEARLAKVRERKILKGEPVADLSMDDNAEDEFEKALAEKATPAVFVEDLTPAVRPAPSEMRPWDKGKLDPEKQDQTYVANRREERNFDFAPPASYSNTSDSPFAKKSKRPNPRAYSANADSFNQAPPPDFYQQPPMHSVPPSPIPNSKTFTPAIHQQPNFSVPPPNYHSTQPQPLQPWEYMQAESSSKKQPAPSVEPWNAIPAWKDRMTNHVEDASKAKHLQGTDERRPYAFAPPPAMYSEELSGAKQMNFGRASEDEIRAEAMKLFSKAKKSS